MTIDPQHLRIEGIYQQRQEGFYMLRVKVPAGVLSALQARQVAAAADRFARGQLHLTTRCSIELHWVTAEAIPRVWRLLQAVGLTGRGACGGAVRGVSCSTPSAPGFPAAQLLARKLHGHFTGNPHFEGLPKKFKIGVEAGCGSGRHLIQDLGVVCREGGDGSPVYDLWVAGGLGREPQPGFLLEEGVPAGRVVPVAEAVLRVYRAQAPAGKRLKHVVNALGREEFLAHYRAALAAEELPLTDGFPKQLTPPSPDGALFLEAGVFAGELEAGALRRLAEIADRHADGYLVLTHTQSVALILTDEHARRGAVEELRRAGFDSSRRRERVVFQVCPGSHECRLGLAATREVAAEMVAAMGPRGERLAWAISGCPNSCSQPQLAEVGVVTVKLVKGEDGGRTPCFDLYRREGEGFGAPVRQGLTREELMAAVAAIG